MQVQDDDKTIVGGFNLELTHTVQVDNGLKYLVMKELTVGRSDACDIKIEDKKISRMHAKFEIVDKDLTITDLNSSNGTFVNGERIHEPTKLKNNDSVKVENHELKIFIGASLPEKLSDDTETKKIESVDNRSEQISKSDKAITPNVNKNAEEVNEVIKEKVEIDSGEVNVKSVQGVENKPVVEAVSEEKVQEENTDAEIKEVINKAEEDIPSSWIEETGSVDGTRMMDSKELDALKSRIKRVVTPADSNVTSLHCFAENSAEQVFELPITNFDEASGWEIGRDSNCDIVIEHSSVSNRHAQIIHQRGRWKIVNLVSTNGIVINGQKKLSAYLGDGDKIGLGSVDLIFKTPKTNKVSKAKTASGTGKGKNLIIPIVMGLVLIGLAVGIYLNI